jgi:hypothetical protein
MDLVGISAGDTYFGILGGTAYDEDGRVDAVGQPDSTSAILPKYAIVGQDIHGDDILIRLSVDHLCYVTDITVGLGTTGRPVYNSFDPTTGIGSLVTMTNASKYMCMHMYVANSAFTPVYYTFALGQNEYANANEAKSAAPSEAMNLEVASIVAKEAVLLYTFIIKGDGTIQAVDAVGNLYLDWRFSDNSVASSGSTATPQIGDVLGAGGTNVSLVEFEYLDGVTSAIQSQLNDTEKSANKGVANGYCELDSNGLIPIARAPASLLGAVRYQGTWNATTDTPTLGTASSENKGYYYIVSVAGGVYNTGDWVISSGTAWDKVDNTDAVTTVAGRTGNVVLAISDITSLQTALDNKQNLNNDLDMGTFASPLAATEDFGTFA